MMHMKGDDHQGAMFCILFINYLITIILMITLLNINNNFIRFTNKLCLFQLIIVMLS